MDQQEITVEWLAAQESFQHYCHGNSVDDIQYWENWLRQHPEYEPTIQEARGVVYALSAQVNPPEIEEELERFHRSLRSAPALKSPLRRVFLWRAAAAVLFLIGGYWAWQQFNPAPLQMVQTAFGEMREVQLPDGSVLQLNANSHLEFAEDWRQSKKREIWLEGLAFFDVRHNPSQPFTVHTAKGDVEVLGTSFDVLNRPGKVQVTLLEGSVQFHLPQQAPTVMLKPNEQIQIENNRLSKQSVDAAIVCAWRQGRIAYKDTPIGEIISQFQHNYGWSIEVNDDVLLRRKVTAQVPENDPALLLDALSVLYDLKIVQLEKGKYRIE